MRFCEFSAVPEKSRTVNIRLGGIRFYSSEFALIPHHHPRLLKLAAFVWVLFEDQKNRLKCDAQTQARTKDPRLCPVLRLGRTVKQVRKFVFNHNKDTPLCTFHERKRRCCYINQKFCQDFLRKVCRIHGGVKRFGFHPEEIGNRSIRSGAAMALFLNDVLSDKIMILGRWKSKAFLDYIRQQVVQWTRLYLVNMISFNNFFELCASLDKRGRKLEA